MMLVIHNQTSLNPRSSCTNTLQVYIVQKCDYSNIVQADSYILKMLPPKYTKTVTVTAHDTPANIIVRYASNKGEETEVEVELGEGESHTFEEKTEDMGSWQAVRKILSVKYEQ